MWSYLNNELITGDIFNEGVEYAVLFYQLVWGKIIFR